jgi:hypothetical protein
MQCPTLPPADIMLAADERAAGRAGLEIVDEAPRIVLRAACAGGGKRDCGDRECRQPDLSHGILLLRGHSAAVE